MDIKQYESIMGNNDNVMIDMMYMYVWYVSPWEYRNEIMQVLMNETMWIIIK